MIRATHPDGTDAPMAALVADMMWNAVRDLPEVRACVMAPLLTGEGPTLAQEVAMNRAIADVLIRMNRRTPL
jgi:hypothetical protein